MKKKKTIRQQIFEKFFYLKMFISRSQAYYGIPSDLFDKAMLVIVFLKLYGLANMRVVIPIAILALALVIYVGYVDVKWGIVNEEMSFNNRFNPELQAIYRNTKRRKK